MRRCCCLIWRAGRCSSRIRRTRRYWCRICESIGYLCRIRHTSGWWIRRVGGFPGSGIHSYWMILTSRKRSGVDWKFSGCLKTMRRCGERSFLKNGGWMREPFSEWVANWWNFEELISTRRSYLFKSLRIRSYGHIAQLISRKLDTTS